MERTKKGRVLGTVHTGLLLMQGDSSVIRESCLMYIVWQNYVEFDFPSCV